MSKKILKRSLALGALMAFVITGSAFAEVILGTGDYAVPEGVHTVNGKVYANTGNYTFVPGDYPTQNEDAVNADKNHIYLNTDLNGYKLYVDAKSNNNKWFDGNGMATGTQWGQRVINIYDSSADKTGDLEIVASGSGIYGVGDINVDELIINAQGNAIECSIDAGAQYDDETLEIMANTIVLTSHSGNGIQANSSVKIGKSETERVGNLTINAADRPLRLAYGDKLDIYADTLNITKAESEIKVDNAGNENGTGTSTMTIFANSGEIESDIIAGTDSSKGAVNLTFGSNVNWIGAISTGANASVGALDLSGTWNLKEASSLTNATFNAGSTLVIEGEKYVYDSKEGAVNTYALNGVGENATLTVENGAKLTVTGIDYNTYNIAKDFATISKDKWQVNDLNTLMEGKWVEDTENKTLQLEVVAKNTSDMATETGISTSTAGLVQGIIDGANSDPQAKVEGTPQYAAAKFIESVLENNPTDAAVGNAINAATKMGEAGGNSGTAASIVKNVTGVTNDRLSFNCGHSAPHKGGHGVGLFEEGSGADVWVEYVHGKDEVEDMPSTAGASSYEGQYNGIVMGVDFKKVNKFQSGIAFNYGEGDTNSVGNVVRTHSDYDFWGVGYYGNIHNDDSNVIFDINYAKTDSDVTQNNSGTAFEANPETTTWSAGVKLEKLYQNENVQIVPYTGLRYMSIDADDYSTRNGEFYYSMDRQDIWLLPLGVSIRQEIANDNGWTVSPRVDLSYIWAFGDTNSNIEVKSPFAGVSQLGYDVMDDGSFLGLVGIEAHKGQWGYGVAYSYQKGDHSESKKWYVDVNYSF